MRTYLCAHCGDPIEDIAVSREACGHCFYLSGGIRSRKAKKPVSDKAKARYRALRHEVFMAYGGYICNCCGETEPLFLELDHVNNNGAEHRTVCNNVYGWVKKYGFPHGFQILCSNCNQGKRRNGGVCPHNERVRESA